MTIKVSKAVKREVTVPVRFAYEFAQRRAQSLGKSIAKAQVRVLPYRLDSVRGYRGRAGMSSKRVLLRFSQNLPGHLHTYARYKNMPTFWLGGGDESVVYVAAHEFGHLIGWPGDKAGEAACCRFGYSAVQAWRDRELESPACLI